ncbi:putative Nudix hydrolase YfcD [Streptomyces sp. RB5]|uniref:Putative Nudix hydrolase YfcD n=1 Tax=Streptomyces smaragdinus TaxID=2585196 RepID=A0A7K0CID3_9ACTN|nr:NUDIX domain-containing protein [Streptomyces smaragdinus]MQY13239.1 putative Nudix hydrolase YfcD [Streptomyces smaragdinus]
MTEETAHSILSADEILDIVDENDSVTGQARRAEVYAKNLRHRCVFVMARDPRGRIFVHRRTADKLLFPSLYDMFVGGVVGAGESYETAALREAEEELGVSGLPAPRELFALLYETEDIKEWARVYEVTLPSDQVAPQPEEVAWWTFLDDAELGRRLAVWPWVPDGLAAYTHLTEYREV